MNPPLLNPAVPVSSRVVLLAGFGGLLLLLTFSGVDAIQALEQIQRSNSTMREGFVQRTRVLDRIRADLYLSGTYVRDYLLEPESGRAEGNRYSLLETRRDMEAALAEYRGLLQNDESAPFQRLTGELGRYWRVLEPVLHWTPEQRQQAGYAFLRDEVFPRRQATLAIADEIGRMNQAELNVGKTTIQKGFQQLRRRLRWTILLTIGLGLLLAAFSMRRILGLETKTAGHYKEIARARGELQQLSARLVEAQEEERRSISRELHDEVGQALTGVLVEMANLTLLIRARDLEAVSEKSVEIKKLIEESIRVVRNLALLLRPSMLDDLGLVPALEWQARELSKRGGVWVDVDAREVSEHLPEEHKTCVYRIVQEALHNIVQHAGARKVKITVWQEERWLSLSVEDDGRGFDPKHQKGMGLVGIEERIKHLGGSFEVRFRGGCRHGLADLPAAARSGGGMKSIRILLADDHTVVRKGLRLLLESQPEFAVVAEAANGREAVAMAEEHRPGVVVMDVGMPILNGIEAARQILTKLPNTAVAFLSMHADESYVLRALKAGARAYLLKDSAEQDLINAVKAVSEGKAFFSPAISKMLVEDYMRSLAERNIEDSYELLTTREREVLQLLAEGKNNKEVAGILNLSLYTVETHRGNILQKLNLHSGAELVLYAIRKGVIS